ncbi:DEAD/DEAH box helicase [Sphingomonas sp. RG327]|uniref:DEAD/DEAH box helicase n=1 Tax=Sphingomonas anseongensis TaxID=2908207 RepID=A0ABT0RFM9_9SPHN|nr:DEAD/DEAH box helicase [Sphingomonas anseongensis]MCL6679082.1 DEAD/DEAH box helicase [Sphingomonas anseongensis]
MARDDAPVRAILGPTNTGKTYLAIERMCGHSSGVIGFPLRLLAREVYDRVVGMKGESQVALLTGEERIVPRNARYFLCTAESMPVPSGDGHDAGDFQRDFAFAAIDEAQLGIDPERGHVFTDRMLRVRGREETLILGSDTLKPMIRELLPDAEIVSRPRFSTLRYSGSVKLSRLPPRSAVVAFSAEQVYALAEALRRFRGGAAVVMGALSPATRNAQVAMFQRGEVDYLVATDAIGMGLNMDVAHVAFAGLEKFDGRRDRRLTIAEMAQIAGRAGRHQRDGTFGTLGLGDHGAEFSDAEIEAIEEHRFRALDFLYWRNPDLDFTDVRALTASLERPSDDPVLRPAPESIDLAVLKLVSEDPAIAAKRGASARRLWAACGLPDFRKVGPMHHARMVRRVFSYIGDGGHIPHEWFAAEVARLENVSGDIEVLADRLAGIRSWAYIAHRSDWLQDPAKWADRTREVEARLSDALHSALTQRFVDRRTSVLVRDIGARGSDALPVTVSADGEVSVGPEPIGHLRGFEFRVDPAARLADKRLLLAAAERRLGDELERRASSLIDAPDSDFALLVEDSGAVGIGWNGNVLARLAPGRSLLEPAVRTARPLDRLSANSRSALRARLERWVDAQVDGHLRPLKRVAEVATDATTSPGVRAVGAMLADAGGAVPRRAIVSAIGTLEQDDRQLLYRLKVRLGPLDVYVPALLKPAAQLWRAALLAVRSGEPMPEIPAAGMATLAADADPRGAALAYRRAGRTWVRVDLADRLASHAHKVRSAGGDNPVDSELATSLGLGEESLVRLMADVGFARTGDSWRWRGRRGSRPAPRETGSNAFAELEKLRRK